MGLSLLVLKKRSPIDLKKTHKGSFLVCFGLKLNSVFHHNIRRRCHDSGSAVQAGSRLGETSVFYTSQV